MSSTSPIARVAVGRIESNGRSVGRGRLERAVGRTHRLERARSTRARAREARDAPRKECVQIRLVENARARERERERARAFIARRLGVRSSARAREPPRRNPFTERARARTGPPSVSHRPGASRVLPLASRVLPLARRNRRRRRRRLVSSHLFESPTTRAVIAATGAATTHAATTPTSALFLCTARAPSDIRAIVAVVVCGRAMRAVGRSCIGTSARAACVAARAMAAVKSRSARARTRAR